MQDPTFVNCTCIDGDSRAESGYCDNNCMMLVPYLAVSALGIIISLTAQIPNVVVTLRYVYKINITHKTSCAVVGALQMNTGA